MPVYTFSHCLFCFRKDSATPTTTKTEGGGRSTSPTDFGVTSSPSVPNSTPELIEKKEICRRFCVLASRYLNIDPYFYNPNKTVTSKHSVSTDRVCDDCFPALKSFCDIYESWSHLQLQLDQRLKEISSLMKLGDVQNAEMKNALLKKMEEVDESPRDLEDFRQEFISCVAQKQKESFPQIKGRKSPLDPANPSHRIKTEQPTPPPPPNSIVSSLNNENAGDNLVIDLTQSSSSPSCWDCVTVTKRQRSDSLSSDDSLFRPVIVKRRMKKKEGNIRKN